MDDASICVARAAALTRRYAPPQGALAHAAATLDRWREASLARREMAALDDRQISDLGLSRAQLKWAVPIRAIGRFERYRAIEHLLALDGADRYWRFAYAATDEQIRRYVERIDFGRDAVLGIFNRKLEMLAMAHLAPNSAEECQSCVEFGVSVARRARGRGFGSRLLERAVTHARNQGAQRMVMRVLSENRPALAIARRAGAVVQARGAESEAWLRLPGATAESRLNEMGVPELRRSRLAAQGAALARTRRGAGGRRHVKRRTRCLNLPATRLSSSFISNDIAHARKDTSA